MSRLVPTETTTIKVHPGTIGHHIQQLVVEKHCFKAPQQPAQQKLALLFSHSNGFNKETLHPLIRRVVKGVHEQPQYRLTDLCVYAWDARNHGDSALLNEGTFSETFTWFDNALDTKQVIDNFDLRNSYDGLIGVGHSFGASSMIILEFLFPNTFTGICAIEPVLAPGILDTEMRAQLPMLSSLKRRDIWPSKEACYKSLVTRSFWKSLHPEVMDLYVNTALYETPEGTVKLKAPKEQEYHVFNVSHYATFVAYNSLRALSIPVHFVYGASSAYVSYDPHTLSDSNPRLVSVEVVEGSHMVPNEHPESMVPQVTQLMDRALSFANKNQLVSRL